MNESPTAPTLGVVKKLGAFKGSGRNQKTYRKAPTAVGEPRGRVPRRGRPGQQVVPASSPFSA